MWGAFSDPAECAFSLARAITAFLAAPSRFATPFPPPVTVTPPPSPSLLISLFTTFILCV